MIQGADSLLCRLSWHCPRPLPFGCHSHHNTELPAKRCLMSSWRWGKVRHTRSEEMEGRVGSWEGSSLTFRGDDKNAV